MKFIITGDLVISRPYSATDMLDKEIIELFSRSDCNIVNLEAPVTESNSKILKTGPYLKADREGTLNVFKKLNIHIAALANNHIKDYGEQGVLDTISFCQNAGIQFMGAGRNTEEAGLLKVLNTPEGTVAIINIAENEWASAEPNSAGANGMDLIKDIQTIQEANSKYDFVFVVVHGGHEYYNLPSPRMRRLYRFYAEQGADLVVGHHTHCINGYEMYKGTPIFYSLGNFIFTKNHNNTDWYTGLILEVKIDNKKLHTKLLPVRQEIDTFSLHLLKEDGSEVLERVKQFSAILQNDKQLEAAWQNFVSSKLKTYRNYWSPLTFVSNRYLKALLRRLKINLLTREGQALYLNLLRCESHHDLSKDTIKCDLNQAAK